MGEITEYGKSVHTVTDPKDQSDARGDSPDVETETQDPDGGESGTSAAESDPSTPGPADIPPPPVTETADDGTERETRQS